MKTLSIIIPHYNGSKSINKLLLSIPDFEWIDVIVVDDHSSLEQFDSLFNICSNFSNVRLYSVPKGLKGPGSARNIGLNQSLSDWVVFADADDFFLKNAFSKMFNFLENDEDVIYFTPTSEYSETGTQASRHLQYVELCEDYFQTLDKRLFYKFYAPWSKLIRRKLIVDNKIKFDLGVGGEDNIFSLHIAFYSKKVDVCLEPIYCVSESLNSLTRKMSSEVLINHFEAMCRYNDFLQLHGEFNYQAPMLGWVLKCRRISYLRMLVCLWRCIKSRYPLRPFYYVKKIF